MKSASDGKARTILVAELDVGTATLIHSNLVSAGFEVAHAERAEAVLAKARELGPALIVLDMSAMEFSGKDVLRMLKSNPATSEIAVIALSEHPEEIDRIVALELGADDFLAKPFSARELALRAKAILSRRAVRTTDSPRLAFGRLVLDSESRTVSVDGKAVDVTPKDFRLLAALMAARGGVVSREKLIESAWGQDSNISPRTVDTQLRRLRRKIRSVANQIHTVRGFGYRIGE